MIARLHGTIVALEPKALVVDVGGVGYRVAVLASVLAAAKAGKPVTLHIHHHVTSDQEALFGFTTPEDLRYFELLLTVPSVGPRTAMGILDIAPPRTLAQAVAENDSKLLTKVSGVGRKTAERILVELKGKITEKFTAGVAGGIQDETISALVSIGFTTAQARSLVRQLPKNVKSVEEAVKEALRSKS